jgi:hypothetical protein
MAPGRIAYPQDVPLENPEAADYLPQYLHDSFPDPSGKPDPKIRDDFYGTRRKLRIGILGAGVCCINFLHYAEQQLRDVEFVVYEKNEDVGGVVSTLHAHFDVTYLKSDIGVVAYKYLPWMSMR